MSEGKRERREEQRRATISVPEASKILGVGRNQGYEAV